MKRTVPALLLIGCLLVTVTSCTREPHKIKRDAPVEEQTTEEISGSETDTEDVSDTGAAQP